MTFSLRRALLGAQRAFRFSSGCGLALLCPACGDSNASSDRTPPVTQNQASLTQASAFPLKVQGRHFIDQNGVAFRIHGEASWDAHINLGLRDLQAYLDDRKARGFNALFTYVANPVVYFLGSSAPFARQLGGSGAGAAALPFSQNISGGAWNGDPLFTNHDASFAAPNDAYHAWVAQFVDEAAARGMVVMLAPMYLGFGLGSDDGWYQTLMNPGNVRSVCNAYGQYLANGHGSFTGFKNRPNVIWVNGGDALPPEGSEGALRALEVLKGMQAAGDTHIQASHWEHDYLPSDQGDFDPYLTANTSYTHGVYPSIGPTYAVGRSLYDSSPSRPAWMIETTYWGEHGASQAELRDLYWGGALSATAGTMFGFGVLSAFTMSPDATRDAAGPTTAWSPNTSYALNQYVSKGGCWFRATTAGTSGTSGPSGNGTQIADGTITWSYVGTGVWQPLLGEPGVLDYSRMGAFLAALPWYDLIPSGLSGTKTLITSGAGTFASWSDGGGETGGMDWINAAATPDGKLLLAYVPDAHSGSFSVDLSALSGTSRARWLDPTSGNYRDIGTYPNTGAQTFSIPGANAAGAKDWVLMLSGASGTPAPASGSWHVALLGILLMGMGRRRLQTR
jgi:hypothetical protein